MGYKIITWQIYIDYISAYPTSDAHRPTCVPTVT
jgi:hypothetical protein